MKKIFLLFLGLVAVSISSGQSNITIGNGSYISINSNSNVSANYRNGSLRGAGYFDLLTIVFDPVAVSASAVGSASFTANWNASSGATGYRLEVSTSSSFLAGTIIAGFEDKDVGNVTGFTVNSNLSAGTAYYYRVRAYDANGITAYSNVILVTTAPPKPVAAVATAIKDIGFTSNWASSLSATGYFIDVASDINFIAGSFVAGFENKNVGNVTTYAITGLSGNTNYYFRVRAYNSNGIGDYSNIITTLTAPNPPVPLAASVITQNSFSANWNASPGATGYFLDVSTDVRFALGKFVTGYQNLDVTNVTSFNVNTNLTAGTNYYYRIRAYNASGVSNNSDTTNLITIPPNPISLAATNILDVSFDANWNSSLGATKYFLDVSTDANFVAGSFISGFENLDVGSDTVYSVAVGITAGTTYYYRIRSSNGSGTSGHSNVVSLVTVPPAPVSLAATAITQTSFDANWNSVSGATKYFLDVSTDNTFANFVTGWNNVDVGDVQSYNVNTAINPGSTYYFRVRAYNINGTSGNSNVTSVLTVPIEPIATAATNVGTTNFNANWNSVASADQYLISIATDAAFTLPVIGWTDVNVGNVTSYTVNLNLSAATTYYYKIKARNNSGDSGYSNIITVLTAPEAPIALAASGITADSFTANWNSSVGATGYYLDVSTNANFNLGAFVSGYESFDVGNVTGYLVNTNLAAGTTYYYRLRSYNNGGVSGYSNKINLETIPAGPLELPATSVSATSFNANWNSSVGALGYRLDVATNSNFNAGTFVNGYEDKDVGSVTTFLVNTNIVEGTTYYYRIRAYNTGGTSVSSGTKSLSTVSTSPVANAATLIEPTRFTANWSLVTGASGYLLDVSTDNLFGSFVNGYNNIDVGNVTSFEVSGLSRGITYYYRVRAYNSSGLSGNSNTRSVITLSPTPLVNPATSITEISFSANWTSATGASGYFLDVATNNTFTNFVTGFNNKDVLNVTTFSVTGLTAGTNYYYRVRAYNASGSSYNSSTVLVSTVPSAPVELAATSIANTSFDANWNASIGVTGYYLDVATDNGFLGKVAGYNSKNIGNVTSYSVTGLSANTQYYYRVRAYNSGGTSSNSGTITVTTNPSLVPIPSLNPASEVSSTSFRVNWNASTGATKYFLDVSTSATFSSFVTDWENVDVGNVLTYVVNTNIVAGNTYYFRLRAYNSSGTSSNSNVVSVKTIPLAPVELAATSILASSFDANWSASSGATGYYLDVATNNGFTSFVSGFNNRDVGNLTSYTVTGLTGATAYYYRIRAYNTGGISTNSGTINTTTSAGGTVIATAATLITNVSFTANWNTFATADSYVLDVSTSSTFASGSFVTGYENQNVGTVTSFVVSGLSGGINYYYRVIAKDASDADLGTSGTINTITLPNPPVPNAASTISEISFDASWNASLSATGYYIDVATNNTFTSFVTGFNNKYVNNVTTYSVTGLAGGVTYYYRVRAKNGSGTGESSTTISTTTIPHEPSSAVATAITNNSFSANWNSSLGADSYKLDVSKFSNFSSYVGVYNNYDVNDVTLSVTGLESGTTYYYRVRAYNSNGTSGNSETVSTLTVAAAPVSQPATSINKTSFIANWNSSVGGIGYYLDVATTSNFSAGSFVAGYQNLNVGNILSYSVTGLTRGSTYYYRVRTYNPSGLSSYSTIQSVLTLPPTPSILSASNIISSGFSANWNSSTSAIGYRLDVSTVSNFTSFVGAYNDLDVGNVNTYSITGLSGGSTYYYRVRAYNVSGFSDYSGIMTVVIAPAAPIAIAASSVLGTSFTANWNSSSGADGYKIDVATDAGFTNILTAYNNKDASAATSVNVIGLTNGQTYYYQVRSYSGSRVSENSNSISVLTKPAVPVTVSANLVTTTSFSANWNSANGASSYLLDVSTDNNFTSFLAGYNSKNVGNVTTNSITGLSANTNYYYRVRASNVSGSSDYSGTINVLSAPDSPTALAATSILNTSFNANWNASAGATGYRLDLSTTSNFTTFVGIYNDKNVGNVTTYSITGLSGSTNYYYRIRAYSLSGTSESSGVISLTTAVDPSGVPISTAATNIDQTTFSANWNAVTGADGYKLDVSTDWSFGAGTFVTNFENKDVGNVTTNSVTGLTTGTTYYYRLRSYNASGTSGNSSSITALTLPANPVATAASSLTTTTFTTNWNSVPSAVGYYLDVATDAGFVNIISGYNNKNVSNVVTYTISGLSGGTDYFYRVRSYNGSGTSLNSNTISAQTNPSAPVSTAATLVAETSFSANWNSVTGATGYMLDVSTTNNFSAGTFLTGYQNKDVGAVVTEQITGLNGGVNYYYRIRAYSTLATSDNSSTITVLTLSSVPVANAASTITETSFYANWNTVAGASTYYLDVSTDNGFAAGTFVTGFQNLNVGNVNTYLINGLLSNSNYYYRIRSYNSSGLSANSNIITALTSPSAPVASAATSLMENGFTANWSSTLGAVGYYLDVSTDINFSSNSFAMGYENKDVGNVTSYSVTDILSGVTHYYRLRAYNNSGVSGNSSSIKVLGTPNANPATIINSTSFSANWDNITDGVLGYRLDVSTDNNFSAGTFVSGYQNKDVGLVTSYTISGLAPYVIYYYRVRSYDNNGQSANSNTISVRNLPQIPVALAPTSIKQKSFYINWSSSAGALGYYIDVSTTLNFSDFVSGYENLGVPLQTTLLVNNVLPGTIYYYRVRSTNASGTSDNSNVISLITVPPAPLATNPTTINTNSFEAIWDESTGADKYYLDLSTNKNFISFVPGYQNIEISLGTKLTINGLLEGTLYYYRVRATNIEGTSNNSNTISVVTLPNVTEAIVAANVTDVSFNANWKTIFGADGYYLDVATDNSFTNYVDDYKNKNVASVISYKVENLLPGVTYYYRVRGYNNSGTGGYSNIINVTLLPTIPIATAPINITNSSFEARWNSSAGAAWYCIDVSTDSTFLSFILGYNNKVLGNVISFNVTNISSNTIYYYRVRAVNSGGTSNNSNNILVNTFANSFVISGNVSVGNAIINYTDGTEKNEAADAAGNYSISVNYGWSGEITPKLQGYTFTPISKSYTNVNENKSNQNFSALINKHTITISASNGSVIKNPDLESYNYGSIVKLTAIPTEGYNFESWSGDASGITNPIDININGNKNITANFSIKTYTLSVSSENGIVTKNPEHELYIHGSSVQLTATPSEGYTFVGWSGDVSGLTNPIIVTMTGNKNITANYKINKYSLTILATNGSVKKEPDQTEFNFGTEIKLIATPKDGYKFSQWTEGDSSLSKEALLQFIIKNNRVISAVFEKINRAPVFVESMKDTMIFVHNVGVTFNYQYVASDPDGDNINFILDNGPEGASISKTGLFSWTPTTNQAGQQFLVAVSISDGFLSESKISFINTNPIIVGIDDEEIPTVYNLNQNYPNPFNPTTVISYQIPEISHVTLKIFDMLGREVETLINEQKVPGNYSIKFDGSNLASGVYIYHLKAGNFVKTKKLLLMK